MAYELIASKVCLLESSLFRIIYNRLKYSLLSAFESMNKRCEIISPWRLIIYPMLLVFNRQESGRNNRMKSNPGGISP